MKRVIYLSHCASSLRAGLSAFISHFYFAVQFTKGKLYSLQKSNVTFFINFLGPGPL